MEKLVLVLLAVVFASLTVYQLDLLLRSLRNYLTVTRRQPIDISHQNAPLPPEAESTRQFFMSLGFERLGETQIQLKGFQKPSKTWIFINRDKTVVTELVLLPIGVAVQFNTIYYDEALLETSYPIGENIDRPDFRSRRVVISLDDAWQSHQQSIIELSSEHGASRQIKSIADVLVIEGMYRQRHFKRKLRPILVRDFFLVLYSANIAILSYSSAFDAVSETFRYALMAFTLFGAFPLRHMLNQSIPPDTHGSFH